MIFVVKTVKDAAASEEGQQTPDYLGEETKRPAGDIKHDIYTNDKPPVYNRSDPKSLNRQGDRSYPD